MTLAPKREQLQQVIFESNLPAAEKMLEQQSARKAFAAANVFRSALVKNLSGSRSGRRYALPGTGRYYITPKGKKRRIPRTGKYYTASRPGEFPAVRFGGMRQSLKVIMENDRVSVQAVTGTGLQYGPPLEELRPFFQRTFQDVRQQVKAIIGGTW